MTTRKLSTPTTLSLILIAIISVSLGLWLSQKISHTKKPPANLAATFLVKGKPLTAFSLIDDNHKTFDLARLKGKWSFMFFGYTNCPDVCPLSMKIMQGVWQKLPPAVLKRAQMVFVSVDPGRDTPEILKSYVQYFHPDFLGVTGDPDQIDILTRQLGILYGFEDPEPGTKNYTVNHSAQIILVDPQAHMRAVFSPPHDAAKIADTFQKILAFVE